MFLTSSAKITMQLMEFVSPQIPFLVDYADYNTSTSSFIAGSSSGVSNSVTPVIILNSPGAGFTRQTKLINVFNSSGTSVEVRICYEDPNSEVFILYSQVVGAGLTLTWSYSDGWSQSSANATAYAPINSPTFTGIPQAPTNDNPMDNSSQLATDNFVQNAIQAYVFGSLINPRVTSSGFVRTTQGGNIRITQDNL